MAKRKGNAGARPSGGGNRENQYPSESRQSAVWDEAGKVGRSQVVPGFTGYFFIRVAIVLG